MRVALKNFRNITPNSEVERFKVSDEKSLTRVLTRTRNSEDDPWSVAYLTDGSITLAVEVSAGNDIKATSTCQVLFENRYGSKRITDTTTGSSGRRKDLRLRDVVEEFTFRSDVEVVLIFKDAERSRKVRDRFDANSGIDGQYGKEGWYSRDTKFMQDAKKKAEVMRKLKGAVKINGEILTAKLVRQILTNSGRVVEVLGEPWTMNAEIYIHRSGDLVIARLSDIASYNTAFLCEDSSDRLFIKR